MQISLLQASITASDAIIAAAQLQKNADQTNLWIAYMNYYLQGCGTPPMSPPPMAMAATTATVMPSIAEVLHPPANVLAEFAKCPKLMLLLKLARAYFAK